MRKRPKIHAPRTLLITLTPDSPRQIHNNQQRKVKTLMLSLIKRQQMSSHSVITFGIYLSLGVLSAFCQFAGPPTSGAPPLSGTVIGDDGKPVQATVTALKIGLPVGSGRAETAPDGSFSMSGLINGKYQLCVMDKAGDYLDPCTWTAIPPTVVIDALQPVSKYKLVVGKGTPLQVRVNDSGKLLEPGVGSAKVPATLLIFVVTTHHTFQYIPVVGKDAIGRLYRTSVPANSNAQIHLLGQGISVVDATGKKFDTEKGDLLPVQTNNGLGMGPPITLTVSPAVVPTGKP